MARRSSLATVWKVWGVDEEEEDAVEVGTSWKRGEVWGWTCWRW